MAPKMDDSAARGGASCWPMDARSFLVPDTLRNGTPVTYRAVRVDDGPRLQEAFEGLDPSSVYTRFFGYRSGPTARELARLGEIDFVNQVMLVVTVQGEAGETIVASGRYMGLGKGAAEVAFTVEEDYQGQGIAGRLLGHLVTIARAHGFERLEAEVLAQNRAMLAVFARSGLPMEQRREGTTIHLWLALT